MYTINLLKRRPQNMFQSKKDSKDQETIQYSQVSSIAECSSGAFCNTFDQHETTTCL